MHRQCNVRENTELKPPWICFVTIFSHYGLLHSSFYSNSFWLQLLLYCCLHYTTHQHQDQWFIIIIIFFFFLVFGWCLRDRERRNQHWWTIFGNGLDFNASVFEFVFGDAQNKHGIYYNLCVFCVLSCFNTNQSFKSTIQFHSVSVDFEIAWIFWFYLFFFKSSMILNTIIKIMRYTDGYNLFIYFNNTNFMDYHFCCSFSFFFDWFHHSRWTFEHQDTDT